MEGMMGKRLSLSHPPSRAIPGDSGKAASHSRSHKYDHSKSEKACREAPLVPCRAELFAQVYPVNMGAPGRMCFGDHSYATARGPRRHPELCLSWGQNSAQCCHERVSRCPKCQDIALDVCSHIPRHRECHEQCMNVHSVLLHGCCHEHSISVHKAC